MDTGTVLLLALVLVCPLMMFWMHRRGHHAGPSARQSYTTHGQGTRMHATVGELRELRADIDSQIAEFEKSEAEERRETPA